MPYRRRKFTRKSSRRPYRKRKAVTYAGLKRVLKRNTELKYFCTTQEALPVDGTTGLTRNLNTIIQGDGADNRDGRVCSMKRLVIRMRIENADSNGNLVRLILCRWYGDATVVGPSDFPQQSGATTNGPLACWSNKKNTMKVLYDRVHKVDVDDPNRFVQINVGIYAKANFQSGATTAANHNGLILFAVSDSSVASHPTISYESQLSFTDS